MRADLGVYTARSIGTDIKPTANAGVLCFKTTFYTNNTSLPPTQCCMMTESKIKGIPASPNNVDA